MEGEAENPLRSLLGDELDALDNTIHNNVLDAGVFALGIFTDQVSFDIVVGSLVAGDRSARADVGEKVESATEGKVEGNVALANRSLNSFSESLFTADRIMFNLRREDP